MRQLDKRLIVAAMAAALILPTSSIAVAATSVTYNIAGIEYAATFAQSDFAGAAVSTSKSEYGVWKAVVVHDLAGITGGTFALKSKIHTFTGNFISGSFGPAVGTCAKTTLNVNGALVGGSSFTATVTRYGYISGASCVVYLATVQGVATLVFAP
jgi:hypothetical protein